jgi:Adenylylsulphate kinase
LQPNDQKTESTCAHLDQLESNAEFIELFVDAPLEVRETRNPNNLYKKRVPAKSANSPESMLPTKRRKILRSS